MLPPYKKSPVLKDIARMVDAAPSTVSFVLNGKAREMRISETLEKKIIHAAKKLGYVPNQVAVSLRTGRSMILGLIVESISGSFFADLAKIIENEADRYGYKIIYCSTENNSLRGQEWLRTLSQRQLDGYIITPIQGMEEDIMALTSYKKPVVLMDSFISGADIPFVLTDNADGVSKGMIHLTENGYKHIGFVTADLDLIQMKEREEAYSNFLKKRLMPREPGLLLKVPYASEKEKAIGKITTYLKETPGLDAVFFATNYLGVLGMECLTRLGWKVPDDLGVMCFDDHDIFRLYPPGITVIRQPVEEIARVSIRLLMDQLGVTETKALKTQVTLPPELIVRKSTRQP